MIPLVLLEDGDWDSIPGCDNVNVFFKNALNCGALTYCHALWVIGYVCIHKPRDSCKVHWYSFKFNDKRDI